jgi:hypothetical protein
MKELGIRYGFKGSGIQGFELNVEELKRNEIREIKILRRTLTKTSEN